MQKTFTVLIFGSHSYALVNSLIRIGIDSDMCYLVRHCFVHNTRKSSQSRQSIRSHSFFYFDLKSSNNFFFNTHIIFQKITTSLSSVIPALAPFLGRWSSK